MIPTDFNDAGAYGRWRAEKLADYPQSAADLMVPFSDHQAIRGLCRRANMALYESGESLEKPTLLAFARDFGLARLDSPPRPDEAEEDRGFTEIKMVSGDFYIPYTNRPLSWHSDGYYNDGDHQIRGVLLHCVRDAAAGGESALLDPEIAYIRLRDKDPALIEALMRPDVLTIPANQEADAIIRPARSGPVFSIREGHLHMRYTARKRNAVWRDDAITTKARACLDDLLNGGEPLTIRHRLEAGQGLISNNVLHNRTGFDDHDEHNRRRLLYRARFLDRIAA